MKLLAISGGRHPYEESTPILEKFLSDAGHDVTVLWEADTLCNAQEMQQYDALIFNTMREGSTSLSSEQQAGLKEFIKGGKGFVCLHISGCISRDWPEYRDITGGGWDLETSFHPPFGKFTVNIHNSNHPAITGLADFVTNDELYMGIEYSNDNYVYITATSKEGTYPWRGNPTYMPAGIFPLGWTRTYGNGKVFVTLLGHNGQSFETPEFQRIVLNGIKWVTD